jgi:hypothetical protein
MGRSQQFAAGFALSLVGFAAEGQPTFIGLGFPPGDVVLAEADYGLPAAAASISLVTREKYRPNKRIPATMKHTKRRPMTTFLR